MKSRRVPLTEALERSIPADVVDSPVSAEFEANEEPCVSGDFLLPPNGNIFENHLRNAMMYASEGDRDSLEKVLDDWAFSLAVYAVRRIVHSEFRRLRLVKLHVALKELRLIHLTDAQIAEECGVSVRAVEKNRAQIKDMVPPITQKFGSSGIGV